MAGLCAGGLSVRSFIRRTDSKAWRRLLFALECLQIALVFVLALVLWWPFTPALCFFVCAVVAGFVVGTVFPTANAVSFAGRKNVGAHVSVLDAADHVVGMLGAFSCGIILLPAVGLFGAIMIVSVLKLLSGMGLVAGLRAQGDLF